MTGRSRTAAPARALPATHQARWLWLGPPPSPQQLAGWALLPLRAFLGITFCFAGLQKLANPAFFDASNPASIYAQMAGAARRSPIHGLLTPLSHHAALIGLVIAIGELAVGVGALLGFLTRIAALGGVLISLGLFLTVSFHTNPYYTGSDIVFVFAWLPLLIAGGGQLSLDALAANFVAARHSRAAQVPVQLPFSTVQQICGSYERGLCTARHGEPCAPAHCPYLAKQVGRPRPSAATTAVDADRRRLVGMLALGVGGVAVLGAGAVAALGRLLRTGSHPARTPAGPRGAGTTAQPSSTATAPTTTAPSAAGKPAGTAIGPATAVPVRSAASFQDPATGDPAIVVQPRAGTFLAFDAVCPHAGCTVQYDAGNTSFICPCHGSQFNATTGAVETGPASTGLAKIAIAEGPDGQLYVH
jgi:thiosulfate dehydrogenase (quinone) large subunit